MSSKEIPNINLKKLSKELYEAAYRCSVEDVRRLLEVGADVNWRTADGLTSLHFAAKAGCVDVVDLLIKTGTDVNARDDFGWTPLHYAAFKGSVEIIRRLIASGADVNAEENEYGYTPLHVALVMSKEETVLELIRAGADVTKVTKRGLTPLHLAVQKCYVSAVEELLKRGAPVNAVDVKGNTPLHYAAECCKYGVRKKMMSLLLDFGADVKMRNKNGDTPLDYVICADEYEKLKELITELRRLYRVLPEYLRRVQGAGARNKIVIRLKKDGVYVDYEAYIGRYMTMSGYTRGYRDEVKQIIRRALRGEKPLPIRVEEIVTNIAKQVLLWIDAYKTEGATAGMRIGIGDYSDISIYATVWRDEEIGWMAEFVAILDGFDGFTNATHRVVRRIKLGKRLDSAAGLLLQMNLLKVVNCAHNIYVEDDKFSYLDNDNDDGFDYFDDDDDNGYDDSDNSYDDYDDDDSSSLKIVMP
jgi:ankyrin repeat protein